MKLLLLLHGAIGASAQLQPLAEELAADYLVHTLEFYGHGKTPLNQDTFSIQLFANDVLRWMDSSSISSVSIFGYSMGGYVGMYLSLHFPERVDKLITLATKYHWDEATATKEIQMLNADKIAEKLPAFATTLAERHTALGWREMLQKTAQMMVEMGGKNVIAPEHYSSITKQVMILLGDRDKMISLEETLVVYKALPTAQLGILPNTQHPIEQVSVKLLSTFIRLFI
jgi:pimeloyl-ACP methyl ester carboxylesterase